MNRHSGPILNEIAADKASVVRGSTRNDVHTLDPRKGGIVEAELRKVDGAIGANAVRNGVSDCLRLLVNFLQHEGLEATLLGGVLTEVNGFNVAHDVRAP